MRTYLRFLNLRNTLVQDQIDSELDMLSQRLLEHIAICQDQKMQLTVSQAMELTFASPATLHRKLDMLIGAGLVDTQFKDGNHRTKHLILTPKAVKQFKQLGQILIKSTGK